MESWEYKIVEFGAEHWTGNGLPDDMNIHMDRFGAKGWELITVHPISRATSMGGSKTTAVIAYFKRKVSRA